MKIMIDLDETICGLKFFDHMNRFFGTDYSPENALGYYAEDLLTEEEQKAFADYIVEQNLYETANIFDDAIEVIERLNKNHKVYICSAYVFRDNPKKSGKHLYNKYNFLVEKFPFIHPDNFVFIYNKTMFDADVKIDDRVSNLTGAKIKLLYTAYHNEDIPDEKLKEEGITRVNSWQEIENILITS